MHVHLPLWEILALRSMAEGQHEDGAHTWGSLQRITVDPYMCAFHWKPAL